MALVPPDIGKAFVRTLAAGLAATLLAGAAARALASRAVGADDQTAAARVEQEVQQRVSASEAVLTAVTTRVLANRDSIRPAGRSSDAAQQLFETLAATLPKDTGSTTGVTVYDATASPVAWAGRVIDLPRARLDLAPGVFIASDPLGPRLVRLEPVLDRTRPGTPERVGTVVAEELLAGLDRMSNIGVTITPGAAAASPAEHAVAIRSADGAVLAVAEVRSSDLLAARARWARIAGAVTLGAFALAVLACIAPLIEFRRRQPGAVSLTLITIVVAGMVVGAAALVNIALAALLASETASPYRLLVEALSLLALVWFALDLIERVRLSRTRLHAGPRAATLIWTAGPYFAAGMAAALLISTYEHYLRRFVNATGVDLLHFSLHPLDVARVAISFALILFHAGIVWAGAFAFRAAAVSSRRPRRARLDVVAILASVAGMVAGGVIAWRFAGAIPVGLAALVLLAAAASATALARPRGLFRRASQSARLALLYLALLVPALALYPSLESFTTTAKERVIANDYAPQAVNLRGDLQRQSDRALEQIDAMTDLPALVEGRSDTEQPTTDQAFSVWARTSLGEHRTTSAIELYAANGRPLSRFAFNLPESPSGLHIRPGCQWTTFEEVTSYAAGDRHVLRATRGICTREGMMGAIVVRVMLDYRTLPFIASLRPFVDPLAPEDAPSTETALGRDVEFTVYGWSQAPIYSFGGGLWPIPASVFERLVAERVPLWTTIADANGAAYRVHFLSDRGGIYALGYPVITSFGHLVNLAELLVLTWVLWVVLLAGGTIFNAMTSRTPASGRALLREIRSSFYRKLWLAFLGATVAPVLILAFAAHTYFVNQFNASVKDDAVRTATVAQRLVEDYAALQPGQSGGTLESLDDQVMILVSQAIDQDVNLFDPKILQATSQPDSFAAGVLPLRTPDDVYRAVMLDRLPTFVGEEQVGRASYLLAAARVRAGQREGIVTVPLTLRAQEEDHQVDNLDREVLFASVLFVMLGAGIGYWMAERIADPVSRLTRATRRIARGDLDARIAATSSDELRRLVEDFNAMAADLKRQRTELERTQRLEAWADMARQVAHDIKNPLTPIQLSAEHARRVNADRGRPLSPVLDDCMSAILTQVKLLRQISAEFSSFASSPTARPETTDLASLIEEVVSSYKTGLAGRIAIVVDAAPQLPSVSIDRTLFSRALTNLIENALFAMPGGGTLTIAAKESTERARRAMVVSVRDTGTGLDQDAMKRIFEPYFSTKASGTGLGLTIAKRNVELNGGTIQVESERGVGTIVTIVLPIDPLA